MVLVAHPDDEVIGCGGSLLALHRDDHITTVTLTDGETTDSADLTTPVQQLSEARRAMAQAAAQVLNVQETLFLGMPDQRLDQFPLLELVRTVQPIVDRLRPEVMYIHSQADLNRDHRIAGEIGLVLSRPVPGSPVEEVYAFEISGSAWGFEQWDRTFTPCFFVDVKSTLELKLKAMSNYRSELRSPPHPRSLDMLRAASAYWGSKCGSHAAEAFELVRAIRRPHGGARENC